MPLFPSLRRRNSKSATDDATAQQTHERPGLAHRTSRKSSRDAAKDSNVEQDGHLSSSRTSPGREPTKPQAADHQRTLIRPAQDSTELTCEVSADGNGLTRDDLKYLFSGAPQFTLEKGARGKTFPQIFFPWDKNLEAGDLVDRRWLKHESFASVTLHAHIPIPDQLNWQPTSTGPLRKEDAWKRPAFELSIFEMPNMLGIEGKEPGTVAMRYFIELPVSDIFRIEKVHTSSAPASWNDYKEMPLIGKHAPQQDRLKLVQEGPKAWKRVGVRDVSTQALAKRLHLISSWHDEVVRGGWQKTVLDKNSARELSEELFTKFIFPMEDLKDKEESHSLEAQIEVLLKVLTTPGAWFDFSLVEYRLHLGQLLWEVSPHEGEDMQGTNLAPRMERRWLLIQLLLSIELVIRLDAALRLGLALRSSEIHVSSFEIHHFDKLRNTKLDWDMVLARKFLDHLYVPEPDFSQLPQGEHELENILILPRRAKLQVEGLLRFARLLDWPHFDQFEEEIVQRARAHEPTIGKSIKGAAGHLVKRPSNLPKETDTWRSNAMPDTISKILTDKFTVYLQAASENDLGGWLSRSWLAGLVLPGSTTCHLLIATLLEQDSSALAKLGPAAYLHGGFILDGRSFWSKDCIVGRIFAPLRGGSESMGWISTPAITPISGHGRALTNCWFNIDIATVPSFREQTRLHDGQKVGIESGPLGMGKGKVISTEFSMPGTGVIHEETNISVTLDEVVLHGMHNQGGSGGQKASPSTHSSSAQFRVAVKDHESSKVSFDLKYNVYFIATNPCRIPHGHAAIASNGEDAHLMHKHGESLPSHPLHQSYKFVCKSIPDLLSAEPPSPDDRDAPVWIVDARGEAGNEVFVRAWCAQVGRHALVSRIGRVCLSCSIREAKAIQVAVIVRVGEAG